MLSVRRHWIFLPTSSSTASSNSLNFENISKFSFIKKTQLYLEKSLMNVTKYRIPLIDDCLIYPKTSEWTSSNGVFALNFDLPYSNWCFYIDTHHKMCLLLLRAEEVLWASTSSSSSKRSTGTKAKTTRSRKDSLKGLYSLRGKKVRQSINSPQIWYLSIRTSPQFVISGWRGNVFDILFIIITWSADEKRSGTHGHRERFIEWTSWPKSHGGQKYHQKSEGKYDFRFSDTYYLYWAGSFVVPGWPKIIFIGFWRVDEYSRERPI